MFLLMEDSVSSQYESARLLLELYELRRESTMRDARSWFARDFNPETLDEMTTAISGPNSAYFRMVTSYWDMAASFVLHNAIDEQMFNDANGEHLVVLAKIEPFLAEFRQKMGNARYLASLETLVMKTPNARERLAAIRERFRAMATTR
jgi:hypothetical protein